VALRQLPPPRLQLSIGQLPLAALEFDANAGIEQKQFLLRAQLVEWGGHTLILKPNYAIQPSLADPRKLSFRFLRMIFEALE
jgi:hypothetical protein